MQSTQFRAFAFELFMCEGKTYSREFLARRRNNNMWRWTDRKEQPPTFVEHNNGMDTILTALIIEDSMEWEWCDCNLWLIVRLLNCSKWEWKAPPDTWEAFSSLTSRLKWQMNRFPSFSHFNVLLSKPGRPFCCWWVMFASSPRCFHSECHRTISRISKLPNKLFSAWFTKWCRYDRCTKISNLPIFLVVRSSRRRAE